MICSDFPIIPEKDSRRNPLLGILLVGWIIAFLNGIPGALYALPLNDPSYPAPLREGIQKAAQEILANHPKKALTILTPLTRTYPDYTVVFTLAGMAYGKSGLNRKAIEMERRALVLDPRNVTARISLGIAEGNTGHFRKEVLNENAVIHDHPEREAAWAALGWAYASLGKWKEARFSEEKAVSLRPSDSGARMILGLALAHEGYLQEALLMEESAQKLSPGDEGIRRSLTFIRQEMNPPAHSKKPKNGFNPLLTPTPAPSSATATPGASQQMSPPPIRAPSVLH